jgi:hypothetical protein
MMIPQASATGVGSDMSNCITTIGMESSGMFSGNALYKKAGAAALVCFGGVRNFPVKVNRE